jgi:hypothetical protein
LQGGTLFQKFPVPVDGCIVGFYLDSCGLMFFNFRVGGIAGSLWLSASPATPFDGSI